MSVNAYGSGRKNFCMHGNTYTYKVRNRKTTHLSSLYHVLFHLEISYWPLVAASIKSAQCLLVLFFEIFLQLLVLMKSLLSACLQKSYHLCVINGEIKFDMH